MSSGSDLLPHGPYKPLPLRHSHSRIDSTTSINVSPDDTRSGAEILSNETDAPSEGPAHLGNEIGKVLNANPIGLDEEYRYVPDKELKNLLTLETVGSALELPTDDDLVRYIVDQAPKTFATIQVVFEHSQNLQLRAVQAFKRTNFTDETLLSESFFRMTCQHYFPTPMPWSTNSLNSFNRMRWQFLVPEFDHAIFQYKLHHQQILPWRGRLHTSTSSGTFGDVSCLRMISSHQKLLPALGDGTVIVARKTLKRKDEILNYNIREEWLRELKAHKELNGRSNHLVRGIAAYQLVSKDAQHDTYHLILEWANGGNLRTFWEANKKPQLDRDVRRSRERVRDVLRQFIGLAEALECMHFGARPSLSRRSSVHEQDIILSDDTPGVTVGNTPPPIIQVQDSDNEITMPGQPTEDFVSGVSGTDTLGVGGAISGPGNPGRAFTSLAKNWRHGDIKPENILRFTSDEAIAQDNATDHNGNDREDDTWLGTLKLADLGRAQEHTFKTALRNTIEKERWRTRYYEPPDLSVDLHQKAHGKISRLFDIWSLGCVIFEGTLWLLYGFDAVEKFHATISTNTEHFDRTPYWIKTGPGQYRVTDAASFWMEHVINDGLEYSHAIADLVRLVRHKLLVVPLPRDSELYTPGFRTHARDMREELERIAKKGENNDAYLFSGGRQFNAKHPIKIVSDLSQPAPSRSSDLLSVPSYAQFQPASQYESPASQATRIAQEMVYTDDMDDEWRYLEDHSFAESWIDQDHIPDEDDGLCAFCKTINVESDEWLVKWADVLANINECELCRLIYKALKNVKLEGRQEIRLIKAVDSFVLREGDGPDIKLLRLCCANVADSRILNIPLGAPDLYEPGRDAKHSPLMKLARAWLNACDREHGSTCNTRRDRSQLPKRLLDVKNSRPKIVDSASLGPDATDLRYIAFSHKWGRMPDEAKTTQANLSSRRSGIPLAEIPRSFQDAIAVTKALGCRYLWIDCLCINQGKHDSDFAEQAGSMQTVFSNAYCVIAAASAEGATSGFWDRAFEHDSRAVRKGNVFISAITNDFTRDVLESPLSKRGWVLQEHALAHRTIFFTGSQMYWECGDGVRCETLRRMRHDVAGLLGDSDFPSKTVQVESTRGSQIHLWTRLFEQYSSLEFTYPEDRSVAIEGLIDRLTTAFKTRSLHGVFENFWGRCLLWKRPHNSASLKRILPGAHAKEVPPSWSWMAVEGVIDFLQPEGGEVDWNTSVVLPFERPVHDINNMESHHLQPHTQVQHTPNGTAKSGAIQATAYALTAAAQTSGEESIHIDNETQRANGQMKCVIICTSKHKQEHHVMLVTEVKQAPTLSTYERVGVAVLLEICIDRSSGIKVAVE